jgi:steroid 5-alpha reductase family enzyme
LSPAHLLACAAALSAFFFLLWVEQTRSGNASHVDAGWAAGLGFMGLAAAALGDGEPARRLLCGAMAFLWSARLAAHLYFDRVRGRAEDGRYAALRSAWGADANRNFFWFFQAQGLLDLVLASSYFAACAREGALGPLDALAALLFAAAIAGETAADRTLAAFRADPANKGKVCRAGLWGWSRHPNYFFEWLVWLSFAALAPGDWRAWIAPPLMLYFLLRVTGIPATEAQALKSRGPEYRRYQEEVSMLIPLPPRRSA